MQKCGGLYNMEPRSSGRVFWEQTPSLWDKSPSFMPRKAFPSAKKNYLQTQAIDDIFYVPVVMADDKMFVEVG